MRKIVLFLVFALLLTAGIACAVKKLINNHVSPSEIISKPKFTERTERQFCGGIAGTDCPVDYQCKLSGSYPDASGVCTKE